MRRTHRGWPTRMVAATGVAAAMLTLSGCTGQAPQNVSNASPQASSPAVTTPSPAPTSTGPGPGGQQASGQQASGQQASGEQAGGQNTTSTDGASAQRMLTAADVAGVARAYRAGTWRLAKDGRGDGSEGHYHDFICQQAILGSVKPRQSRHRDFASSREEFSASQWVAVFSSPAKAGAAYDRVNGWVRKCGLDESRPNIGISGVRQVGAITAGGGRGDAWVYDWEDGEGPGVRGAEFVGVGLRGTTLTVATFRAPRRPGANSPAPSESMVRAALQRLAG